MRRAGRVAEVRTRSWLDRLAVAATLAVAIAHLVAPHGAVGGLLAGAAGLSVAAAALFTFAELAGAQAASQPASESVGTLEALTVEGTAVETAIAGERATG